MTWSSASISGAHKAEIASELVHALVVIIVIAATTLLSAVKATTISQDTVGVVFGAAIGYASGRAGSLSAHRATRRLTDPMEE